jgi:putative phage-type endonuclease
MNIELIDITDLIIPEENPKFFNDEESLEIYQTCIYLMEEFIKEHPRLITEPDFDDIFDENIEELMHSHFDCDIFYNDEAEDEMEEIIEHAKNDFFKDYIPPRSYPDTRILETPDYDYISEQLNVLRNKPQPTQRTKEWYEFRHNLITASNAYKAFESQSTQNQLIYEKCKPPEEETDSTTVVMVNTNTTLHWGQKYEKLSVLYYEDTYETKIEDFGCIQHEQYPFLGASPDGINILKDSPRYGRMLEIKNIVNRDIDGIPKKEYWIQMQLQMEVCDLDECDFLETKFIEYPDIESYITDSTTDIYEDEDGIEFKNLCVSKDDKLKGQIIHFHTKDGSPFYLYKPFDIIHPDDISNWQEKAIEKYQNGPEYKYIYMKTIYWKLEFVSCVLVCRNRQWFKDNIGDLELLWKTVEKERVTGYEHRAPNRRQKPENTIEIMTSDTSTGCLLKFNKDTGKITVIKKEQIDDV